MDVCCPACAARYIADDEKLRGKTARMRCKACKAVWLVTGPKLESPPATMRVGAAPIVPPPAQSVAPPMFDAAPATQPSPEQIPTRRAAVIKRGAEREKRDMFAGHDGEQALGMTTQQLPPPSVGARNENSVLFSIDQLRNAGARQAEASTAPPAPSGSVLGGRTDDEGVIDLQALSTVPPRVLGNAMPVAPLFSEPPPMAFDVGGARPPQQGPTNRLLLIGGLAAAAIFLLVTGFTIAVVFRGEQPRPIAAVMAPPAPPPPAPTVGSTPAPAADPEPAPVASAEEEPADKKEATGKKKKGKGKARRGVITNKSPAPAAKKVKPADPCGCKGDFNCILACTAKGG